MYVLKQICMYSSNLFTIILLCIQCGDVKELYNLKF